MSFFGKLKKPENLWLLLILVAASLLRFWHYGLFSYSNDELSALNRLQFDTFHELVQKGFYVDGHPGGIQVFLWYWVRLFGDNQWVVRLPFVILGILSVFMVYKVARRMFGLASSLFSAAAIAFLQFPVLFSQIARPYGPGMLFCLMLVHFWLCIFFDENGNILRQKPRIVHLAGFALSAALCMYDHYFSFLFALIVGLSGLIFTRRNNIFLYLTSGLFAALLFVPHIPITLNHLTYKGVGLWLGVPGKTWIIKHLYYIFDQSVFTLILFIIALIALRFVSDSKKPNLRFRLLLAVWFLLPMLTGYFYSRWVNPVLQHSVLIFSFPYFIILIFSSITGFEKKKQWVLGLFLAAGIFGTTVINGYYKQQHFGEFKDIARLTAKWQKTYGNNSITKVISINSPFYINYYLNQYKTEAIFDLYDIEEAKGLQEISNLVKESKNSYFLYALTKPSPQAGEDIIRASFPHIIEAHDYSSLSSVILFSKVKGSTYEEAFHLKKIQTWNSDLSPSSLVTDNSGCQLDAFTLDSTAEYSTAIIIPGKLLREHSGVVIVAEATFLAFDKPEGTVLQISLDTPDGHSIAYKGSELKYFGKQGNWSKIINTFRIEEKVPFDAVLKIYFYNVDHKILFINKLNCTLYEKAIMD